MKKYWCNLCGPRRQVTLENCGQCDVNSGLELGSYEACEARAPYVMQIVETFSDLKWWLKLLWTDTIEFPYYLVSKIFQRLGLKWGWSVHIKNGKVAERKLHIGLKET